MKNCHHHHYLFDYHVKVHCFVNPLPEGGVLRCRWIVWLSWAPVNRKCYQPSRLLTTVTMPLESLTVTEDEFHHTALLKRPVFLVVGVFCCCCIFFLFSFFLHLSLVLIPFHFNSYLICYHYSTGFWLFTTHGESSFILPHCKVFPCTYRTLQMIPI